MAAVGVVSSVVVVGVLVIVFIAIVVDSVVVVLMVGIVGLVETVEDSGPEFTSLLIVRRTNASIPRPRSAPRTRKRENGLNFHLRSCRVDTCPSLGGLTGWRKITTLVSFPFILATEPRRVLHLQFVRL